MFDAVKKRQAKAPAGVMIKSSTGNEDAITEYSGTGPLGDDTRE
jgi:hypothetical protein